VDEFRRNFPLNLLSFCSIAAVLGKNNSRKDIIITLTHDPHRWFGENKMFFEAQPNEEHTYCVQSLLPPRFRRHTVTGTGQPGGSGR
jgi:hypothetical protein